jgi:hypothetical protein
MNLKELLLSIEQKKEELAKLENTLFDIIDVEKIEKDMYLGFDDWLDNFYLSEDKSMITFVNAHTEVNRDIEYNIEDIPLLK